MSLLRVDSSVLGSYSSSRELADIVQKHWLEEHPSAVVTTRDLAQDLLPTGAWAAAVRSGQTPKEQWTAEETAAAGLAATLYDELAKAETIIVATGLYNWGINQYLKSWIDLIMTDGRCQSQPPVLQGKDVALVVARGGYYGPGAPKEGWDHGTPWLERVLSEVWGGAVTLIEREFTLVGRVPALDQFTDQAAELYTAAKAKSQAVGRDMAAAYAARKSA